MGNRPIDFFNVLYPRSLYFESSGGNWFLRGVHDVTDQLPSLFRDCRVEGNTLTLVQPDPNRPQFDRPPMSGWLHANQDASLSVPREIGDLGLIVLREIDCTFFQVRLHTPLEPLDSRWFAFQINAAEVGVVEQTPLGPIAIHQLASPIDVRHTVQEKLETGLRRAESTGAPTWVTSLSRNIIEILGVTTERRCEIEYYELVVNAGPPSERFLISWEVERDLRMRSNNPRRNDSGDLLYEWKSGTILRPDGYPWKNAGFILHLKLVVR